MRHDVLPSRSLHVVVAVVVVAVLGAILAIRLIASTTISGPAEVSAVPATTVRGPVAPPATVPAPRVVSLEALVVPCWSCSESSQWPVRFRTDLDLLAPLGTGTGNAAVWFKDFTKPDGARYREAVTAMERRIDGPADVGKMLPPDDPLLREAEPWCDQAVMRFYPDFYPLQGFVTKVPNLLLPLAMARSWVARGRAAAQPDQALADFRRAIRLGRLLRQEDNVVISDLVGLACIRLGTEGIYRLAVKQGDSRLALTAAIVLGEAGPQRLMTAQRLTRTDLRPYVTPGAAGMPVLTLPDRKLEEIVEAATSGSDRRFRGEAIVTLNIVRFLGTPAQQDKALTVLGGLAAGSDPGLAANAAWSRDTRPGAEYLADALQPLP